VGWGPVRRGQAEITGIPRQALRLFSTRRDQIDTALEAAGASGAKAAQVACLTTRPPKPTAAGSAAGDGSTVGLRL